MIPGDKDLAKRVEPGPSTIGKDGVIQQGKPSGPPHEGSRETYEGKIISVPKDYCYKKVGSGRIIIGFRIWAWQREATNLADSVTQGSLRSHVKGSIIKHCYGDEKGDGGGIWSHTHNAECTPKTWSETVTFEGRNAVRDSDEWWMNRRNTWGVLDYKKNMSTQETPTASTVDAKMQLAFLDTRKLNEAEESVEEDIPGAPHVGGGVGGEDFYTFKNEQFKRSLENALLRAIIEHREWLDAQEAKKNAVRQTGEKCPCIVGTYQGIKLQCRNAQCGGQAHHIVADKYLRLGTRPAPGAVDPNRIKGMPSLNDGPSICLNGNAGDEDSDHNIAHQNDGYIQELGNAHDPKGTLPIGRIRQISVDAAKAAAPPDAECQSKIDRATGIDKYGGKENALARSTNNPPAAGSPAMNYFRPPQPVRR